MSNQNAIEFIWNHKPFTIDFESPDAPRPSTTVLQWLRGQIKGKGTKEGCGEGDCGACTVVAAWPDQQGKMGYHAVNSCLIFLPWLHGKHLITIEGLQNEGKLHYVQQAVMNLHGTQCGFCTPGIVMSLFALEKSGLKPTQKTIVEAMSGNLCRCTGYDPINTAANQVLTTPEPDLFTNREQETLALLRALDRCPERLASSLQTWFAPRSAEHAAALLEQNPGARLLNGGTDLAIGQTKHFDIAEVIVSLDETNELKSWEETDTCWKIGSAITIESIREQWNQPIPMFEDLCHRFASKQIREKATLGGNLGTASPVGDFWPVLIALKATVTLANPTSRRELPVEDLVVGYRATSLAANELIVSVNIPKPEPGWRFGFSKISKRRQTDISTVSLAVALQTNTQQGVSQCIIVAGGMADRPKRASLAEQALLTKTLSRAVIHDTCQKLTSQFTPLTDARASAEGRSLMAFNALNEILLTLSENKPNNHD